jgi:hypothetical protein
VDEICKAKVYSKEVGKWWIQYRKFITQNSIEISSSKKLADMILL